MIKVSNLSKSYDADALFTNISFTISDGERVGLIGRNGCGKTTLLRIIAGLELADEGSVQTAARDRIGYLPQISESEVTIEQLLGQSRSEVIQLEQELKALQQTMTSGDVSQPTLERFTTVQERFLMLNGYTLQAEFVKARDQLGINHIELDRDLRSLSGGEASRAMLAGVLLRAPTVLLLDEPTNHLDWSGLDWLEKQILDFSGAVIVVSHDRRFLDVVVNQIFELQHETKTIAKYPGGYSDYLEAKKREQELFNLRYEAQRKRKARLQADISMTTRQAAFSERNATGLGKDKTRRYAKKVAKKALSRKRRLERMVASEQWLEKPQHERDIKMDLNSEEHPGRRTVLIESALVAFGQQIVLRNVDLTVMSRERIAVVGANGVGKSTLLRLISGQIMPTNGKVIVNGKHLLLEQTSDELWCTISKQPSLLQWFRQQTDCNEEQARTILGHYRFDQYAVNRPLTTLSPGEYARARIAVVTCTTADLLLLDEPTNHLDLEIVERFEAALTQFRGALVVVTHDRRFIEKLKFDRILELSSKGIRDATHQTFAHPERSAYHS